MTTIQLSNGVIAKKESLLIPAPTEKKRELEKEDRQKVWNALQVSNLPLFPLFSTLKVGRFPVDQISWTVAGL